MFTMDIHCVSKNGVVIW